DLAPNLAHHLLHRDPRVLHIPDHPLRVRPQHPTRSGQLDTPRKPIEERCAQLALEGPDPLRQRRLRNETRLGGTREMPVLGDREEVPQLPQIHMHSLSIRSVISIGAYLSPTVAF